MTCSVLAAVWGVDESGWEWRPDGDDSRILDDRSVENITESGDSGREVDRLEKIKVWINKWEGRQWKKSSNVTVFPTWAVGWMVEPFAKVRNLRGRCLGEKDEEMNVGHAEFQVPEEHPVSRRYRPRTQKQDLADIIG